MEKTLTVVFDGRVFRPDSLPDLKPNARYVITIQEVPLPIAQGDAWDVLEALTGVVEGPDDWAGEHDHYLYGIPKSSSESAV